MSLEQLVSVKLNDLTRKELKKYIDHALMELSGDNYEKVKYKKITVTQHYEKYCGSDIDGYNLPNYFIEPDTDNLDKKAEMLQDACKEKYEKYMGGPVSRKEYNKLLEKIERLEAKHGQNG